MSNAPMECPHHHVLAWSYSHADELYFPVSACRFREGALAPCKGGAVVVIGRASYGSEPEAEVRRALERGRNLARILKADYLRQCGTQPEMNWYVLNLGPYGGTTLRRKAASQREVSVLLTDGPADLDRTIEALQRHIHAQPLLGDYTTCDLHSVNRASSRKTLVRRLECGQAKMR